MARSNNRRDLFIQVSGNIDPLKSAMTAGKSVLAEFGTAAVDLQAEVGRAFGKLADNAPAQAKALEQNYMRSFSAIRANAEAALASPTGAGAIDVLNAGAARQAAEAAETKAASLRIVADAAVRSASATDADTAAHRAFALAAVAAAEGANQEAAALRAQATVLSGVEAQIEGVTGAKQRMTVMTGQARAGMQQLGMQANDVAVQLSMGTPPAMVFAMQISQVTQALSMMDTKGSGVLKFLGGPWGIGLGVAATVLVPFITNLLQSSDALGDETKKLQDNAEKTRIADQAKAAFAQTLPGVTEAIRAQREALEEEAKASWTAAERANEQAFAEAQLALKVREQTAALLAQAKAQQEVNLSRSQAPGERGNMAALAVGRSKGEIARLEAELAQAQANVGGAQANLDRTRANLIVDHTRRMADPIEAIRLKYDGRNGLVAQAARRQVEEKRSLGWLELQTKELGRQRDAAIQAEQAKKSAARSGRNQGPLTSFSTPVNGPMTGRFGEDRGTHRHQGVDYAVPAGTPVRAPATGVVSYAGERGAYGNVIYINFGGGIEGRYAHLRKFNVKAGERVEAGDVIGLSGGVPGEPGAGRSTGAHLHEEIRVRGRVVDPRKRAFRTDEGQLADLEAKTGARTVEREAELAHHRALHELDRQIEVARAKGDDAELERLGQVRDLKRTAHEYEEMGLDAAAAKAAAERDLNALVQARAEKQAAERADAEAAFALKLAELRGDHEAIQLAENKAYLAERTTFWKTKGLDADQAALKAGAELVAIEGARLQMAEKRSAERARDRAIELSRLRGDPERVQRDLQRQADIDRRTQQYEEDGVPASRARGLATREVFQEFGEEDQARLQGQFRDTVKGGIMAALEGDFSDWFENWWKDRLTRSLEDALNNVADLLFNLVSQAFGQGAGAAGGGGSGGLLGSVLGSLGGMFGGGGGSDIVSYGSGPSSFGDFSGLGFAKGGRPPAGKASLVGEEGMELFVPDAAGTVIPNHALSSIFAPKVPRLEDVTVQRGGTASTILAATC